MKRNLILYRDVECHRVCLQKQQQQQKQAGRATLEEKRDERERERERENDVIKPSYCYR
jgi:hypothetical protein